MLYEGDEAPNKEGIETEIESENGASLEAEFNENKSETGLDLAPAEESLVSLREFLTFLCPDAVLEWNSRAQMAEGHFTVNDEKYRVVTTEDHVYVGDFETNLGRAFPRHVKDGASYVYPPPILRFMGLPETLFEPETDIIEGTAGTRFVVIEVPVENEVEEVETEEIKEDILDDTQEIVLQEGDIQEIDLQESRLDVESTNTVQTPMRLVEVTAPMPVVKDNSVFVLVNIFIVIVLIGVVIFYKREKGMRSKASKSPNNPSRSGQTRYTR